MKFLHSGFAVLYLTISLFSKNELWGQHSQEIPGEYIIQVRNETSIARLKNVIVQSRSSESSKIVSYHQIMRSPFNLWLLKFNGTNHLEAEMVGYLKESAEVLTLQKNRYLNNRAVPNDPDYIKQWQYKNDGSSGGTAGADMDIEKAWDITTGGLSGHGDTIVICVIDDGINGMHPDIMENIWVNKLEIPGNNQDDDGNGFVDDYRGWNIVSKNDNVWNGATHGTPVAGIIGASGNNGIGVSGVNWKIKLMPVNYGVATEASALASYEYAYVQRKLYNTSKGKKGAYIVATNASWGVDNLQAEDAPLWCALFDSLGSIGVLNCGATANADTDVDVSGDMPTTCKSEYLITATNLNRSDMKLNSAGYGKKSIDLGAYGHQVFTTTRNDYGNFGGTSGAAPHVTGLIGLIYSSPCSIFQELTKTDPAKAALVAKDMLLHGVSPNISLNNITTTSGKLNAFRAVKNTMLLCDTCSPPAGITLSAEDLEFKISWANNHGSSRIAIRYRETGTSNWTEEKNVTDGQIIGNLKHCTEYEVQIGSDCGYLPGQYSYSKYINTKGCCDMPVLEPVISSVNAIELNWKANTDDQITYRVSYKGPNEKWLDTLVSSNQLLLKRITECTAYTFKIQAFCKKFNNQSDPTPEFISSTSCGSCSNNSYCVIGRKDASQEWIESFTLNNITHKSGTSKEGYRDFSGVNNIILESGKAFNFFIKPEYDGTPFSDYFKIYLDSDQNGKWTPEELLFQSEAVKDSVKSQIKIPLNAVPGYAKLRVIMSYEKFDGACDNPEFEYGEVEDYCVFIKNNQCINSGQIKAISIGKNEVSFINNYFLQGIRDSIKIHFRVKGENEWKIVTGKDTLYAKNLKECTGYEYRYQLRCDTILSAFSAIDTFTTSCKISVADPDYIISIMPVPATDYLIVDIPNKTDRITYEIKHISGSSVYLTGVLNGSILSIDHLTSGVYILTLRPVSRAHPYHFKFIKI